MPHPFDPARQPPVDLRGVAASFVDAAQDRAHKRAWLAHLAGRRRVVDVGCGEGTLLDLLREQGIDALGLDHAHAAVEHCTRRGHRALCGEAVVLLQRLAEERQQFDGAVLGHVVEHLPPAQVAELLVAVARVLAPDGCCVVVTPNVRNLIVLEQLFWLDPTHVRPYPRLLLERLGGAAGLRVVASYDDPTTVPRRSWWRRALARTRSVCSGADRSAPLDAVVVFARA